MKKLIALAAAMAASSFSRPVEAQILPPAKRAVRVRILEGPRLELATDWLTVLKWTTDNPGGSDVHYGVVRYGTDPTDLSRTVKSPIRMNRGHRRTTFRVRLDDLEPRTTYYYRVASEESSGSSDGAQSAICKFTTPRPGERIVFVDRRM